MDYKNNHFTKIIKIWVVKKLVLF